MSALEAEKHELKNHFASWLIDLEFSAMEMFVTSL